MLVVDASVVAGWLLPDEDGPEDGLDPAALLAGEEPIAAPWLLWAEFRNILVVSERRGRLAAGIVEQAVEAVEELGIALDTTPSGPGVVDLARRHGLTVYDALYLELALRGRGRLATRDAALRRAAVAEGVAVV
jgi:predicted nucleic acid-binding protein